MKLTRKDDNLDNMLKEQPIDLELGRKYFRVTGDKLVGRQLGFRIQSKDVKNPTFLKWLSVQTNLSDSIRYLIEQEILINGVRNLAKYIPQDRDLEEALDEQRKSNDVAEPIFQTPISIQEVDRKPVMEPRQEPVVTNQSSTNELNKNQMNNSNESDRVQDNKVDKIEPIPSSTLKTKKPDTPKPTPIKKQEEHKEDEEVIEGWNF